jgi:SET domain-containing protein
VATSPIHGYGLFADTDFDAGDVVGRLEGVLTDTDGTHVLWVTDDLGIEVTNDFRFINHSDEPNCSLTMSEVVTLRPIDAGEELTYDYSGTA